MQSKIPCSIKVFDGLSPDGHAGMSIWAAAFTRIKGW